MGEAPISQWTAGYICLKASAAWRSFDGGDLPYSPAHEVVCLPLWLAPDRVRVITLNDDEAFINYAQPIVAELRANMVRVDSDFSATPFKAKIAQRM